MSSATTHAADAAAATTQQARRTGLVVLVRRHPLGAYLVLAFALSWAYWVPLALAGGHGNHVPGLLGPLAAGLLVTAIGGGREATRALLARMVRWRVPAVTAAVALAPAAVVAALLAATALSGSPLPPVALEVWPGLPPHGWAGVFALALLVNGYGEEVGWRGIAWPLLRRRHSVAGAALLVALPWALWHLPTFWIDTGLRSLGPAMVAGWALGLAAGSVVLGWLHEHGRGSLLLVALFHTGINLASAAQTTSVLPAVFTSAGVVTAAVVILGREARRPGAAPRGAA
ncbi:MAG TPA: CPBP family intramembrane glutamic endopeptidase [Egibacteraceae bacterium]